MVVWRPRQTRCVFHARERKHIKLVRLHLQKYEKHLAEVQKELEPFEQQYGISSEECYQRFMAGEMGDAAEIVEWMGLHDNVPTLANISVTSVAG
jgi:hypothetical protein